jgi:hypothetical protein
MQILTNHGIPADRVANGGRPSLQYCEVLANHTRPKNCRRIRKGTVRNGHEYCQANYAMALFRIGKGTRKAHKLTKYNPLKLDNGDTNAKFVLSIKDGVKEMKYVG